MDNPYVSFQGTVSEYRKLHYWVVRLLGKPQACKHCGTTEPRRYEWANVSHEYKKDLSDWVRLCKPCHAAYDRPDLLVQEYCKRNHRMVITNIYVAVRPSRRGFIIECRKCRAGRRQQYFVPTTCSVCGTQISQLNYRQHLKLIHHLVGSELETSYRTPAHSTIKNLRDKKETK